MGLGPGNRVGVYEIVGPLGSGGMGEVYRARDTRLGRLVAIKFVSDELANDGSSAARLAREAELTSSLNHPNIVTVHDVGEVDGRPFIVMELIAGHSLFSAMESGPMKPSRVADIACQIADGLAAAHGAGVVHRDLKPRNVMVAEEGHVKIVDFGLGKVPVPLVSADASTVRHLGLTEEHSIIRYGRLHVAGTSHGAGNRLPLRSVLARVDSVRDAHGRACRSSGRHRC
jgi:serine/threonine protein kinase